MQTTVWILRVHLEFRWAIRADVSHGLSGDSYRDSYQGGNPRTIRHKTNGGFDVSRTKQCLANSGVQATLELRTRRSGVRITSGAPHSKGLYRFIQKLHSIKPHQNERDVCSKTRRRLIPWHSLGCRFRPRFRLNRWGVNINSP